MTGAEPSVLFEKRDAVLQVSLNRTAVLNAVNIRVLKDMEIGLRANAGNPDIKVLMLSGRGRCFASGADIEELADLDETGIRQFHQLRERTFALLENFPSPTVAVIQGYALGTGLELALCCDFRIAAADAMLGVPSAKLGIAESYEYISRLVQAVGPFRAKKLLLTGERIDAAAAFHIGLIEEVVPVDDLLNRAETLAADIALNSTQSMVESKKVVAALVKDPNMLSVQDKAATMVQSMHSADFREGVAAFMEKRRARFR
ncbi:MAG: enoyl-CoA hydratase-related protein [Syntrophobacteraceae bacterium]|jgi:enoyl-CoA hydratase/carnithine racemase